MEGLGYFLKQRNKCSVAPQTNAGVKHTLNTLPSNFSCVTTDKKLSTPNVKL